MRRAPLLFLLLATPASAAMPELAPGIWTNSGELYSADPACPAALVEDQQDVVREFAARDEITIRSDDPFGMADLPDAQDTAWREIREGRWERAIRREGSPIRLGTTIVEVRGPDRFTLVMEYQGESLARDRGLSPRNLRDCVVRFVTIWTRDRDLPPDAPAATLDEDARPAPERETKP